MGQREQFSMWAYVLGKELIDSVQSQSRRCWQLEGLNETIPVIDIQKEDIAMPKEI